MRVLVLSDSHSTLWFMRQCARALNPDAIIHLGDYYEDGEAIHQEFPHAVFFQVPGNCDAGSAPIGAPLILNRKLKGVRVYMTHGHVHHVKEGFDDLIRDAREAGAQLALFGHTHRAYCEQMEDGMWVMNPGTCGGGAGTAGVVELDDGIIQTCRIVSEYDFLER